MFLKGERVTLREARASDQAELEQIRGDPEIDHYMGVDTAPEGTIWNRVFVGAASGALADYVLQDPDARIIGLLSFWQRAIPHQAAELSIWLAQNYRDQGYGRDALQLCLPYMFERFQLHKVCLRVLTYNTRAIRCYEHCGFRKEGLLREEMHVDGVWYDLIYMGLLRSDLNLVQDLPDLAE